MKYYVLFIDPDSLDLHIDGPYPSVQDATFFWPQKQLIQFGDNRILTGSIGADDLLKEKYYAASYNELKALVDAKDAEFED